MKLDRFSCFLLTALIGCSSGPVDLGDPGAKDEVPHEPGGDDNDGNERPGELHDEPGHQNPDTSTPASAPETVLEATSLAEVDEIRSFDLAGGKLYYSGAHDSSLSLYRYDIASKANVVVARDYGGVPYAADADGFFYAGLTSEPVQKAIVGMPLTSTTHAPEWFSPIETIATAVAIDPTNVYWVERGELHTFFRIAHRTAFTRPPTPAYAFGPSVPNNSEYFAHLVIDQGVGYAAGDRGRLVRFDIEIATTVLATGGPKNGFVMDATNLYWVDGADLKALAKTAAAGASPSVIASLPADATNVLGGAGAKGVYVLTQPSGGSDSGKVLRIDPTTGTPTELATKLGGLRAGVYIEKSLYFVTSKGVLRLNDG